MSAALTYEYVNYIFDYTYYYLQVIQYSEWRHPRCDTFKHVLQVSCGLHSVINISRRATGILFKTKTNQNAHMHSTCSKMASLLQSLCTNRNTSLKELRVRKSILPLYTGWFSNRTGTSFDDGKARGKDWTRLPVPNLSLCHWSIQLFDLRAPSSTDIPVLLLNQPTTVYATFMYHNHFKQFFPMVY